MYHRLYQTATVLLLLVVTVKHGQCACKKYLITRNNIIVIRRYVFVIQNNTPLAILSGEKNHVSEMYKSVNNTVSLTTL